MDTRDLHEFLDRYERLAHRAALGAEAKREAGYAEDRLAIANSKLSMLKSDLAATEEKLKEWIEYARLLSSAIDLLDPKARRRKASKILMPLMPKPLETEIPF